jgi:hypothetical protein
VRVTASGGSPVAMADKVSGRRNGPCPLKINVKRESSMLRCPNLVLGNRAPWAIPRSRAVRFATARASNLVKPHFSRDLREMLDPSEARA